MKRLTKVLCIALLFGLVFAGLAYAEGEEGTGETDESVSQEQTEGTEQGGDTQSEGSEQTDGEQTEGSEQTDGEQTEGSEQTDGEQTEGSEQTEGTEQTDGEQTEAPQPQDGQSTSSARPTYLWIGLAYGSGAVDKITLRCNDGFVIMKGNNKGLNQTDITTSSTTLTIVASGGKAALIDSNGKTLLSSLNGGAYVVMSAAANPENRLITINGSRYRDGATATVQGSKLNVINVIELEHYVRGVIANEMGHNYPLEALKAQAITARSYGYKCIDKHRTHGFDLCTTQDCQVYRGYASEHASTNEACRQTEGKVLSYNGKIVEAYYYAYSGGATLNSEDVWLNALGYCRGKVDEYYSDYKWAVQYTAQELTKELKSRGKNIGDVVSVQVTRRHATGAVAEVTFVGTNGKASFSKSSILSVLGLKSFVFALNDEAFVWTRDGQAVVTDASVSVIGADSTEQELNTVCVIGADGTVTESSASDIRISNGTTVAMPQGTVSEGWTDDPVNSGTVHIAGSGWGHGVGMPQTSAKNMAELGYTCEDILHYYYEGTEIGDLADFQ